MKLNAYLTLDGTCEEAFRFYAQCLRGQLTALHRFGETPGCEQMPASHRDKVMHVRLEIGDQVLMGSDNPPGMPYEGVRNSSLALSVPQVEEAARIFSELAEGGAVIMPMQETFWARSFGMVNDRFGVPWLINGAPQTP